MINDNTSLEEFMEISGMTRRCYNCCSGIGIKTFGEFMDYVFTKNIRNIGNYTFQEIISLKSKYKDLRMTDNECEIDWEHRRYEIAKTVIHGQLTGPIVDGIDPNPSIPDLAKWAVKIADALIAELKERR